MARATIVALAEKIRELEAAERPHAKEAVAVRGWERLLPAGGLRAGSVVEIVSRRAGAGAWTAALMLARCACGERKRLLVGDVAGSVYPPALARSGFDPRRVAVARGARPREVLAVLTQGLRCSAVGAAVGRFDHLASREARRLQLAAESQAGLAILLRPWEARLEPSFAELRWLMESTPTSGGERRRVRIEVLRMRGGPAGHEATAEIDDATGALRLLSGLGGATKAAARATG